MGFFDALSRGLERSREALNEVFYFGGEVDEDFWEDLEDTLVMGDIDVYKRQVDLDADEELIEWAHLDAVELLRYACTLDSVATRPLRDAVAMRYRHIDVYKRQHYGRRPA